MKPFVGAVFFLALGVSYPAFAQRPCQHVPQSQRMDCLNAELRAGEARREEIDRRNRNLDRGIAAARAVNNAGRGAAAALGGVAGAKLGHGDPHKAAHGAINGGKAYDAAGRVTNSAYRGYLRATERLQEKGRQMRERRREDGND